MNTYKNYIKRKKRKQRIISARMAIWAIAWLVLFATIGGMEAETIPLFRGSVISFIMLAILAVCTFCGTARTLTKK